MENQQTCEDLWNANLIGFKNNFTGDEYAVDRIGSLENLYDQYEDLRKNL